MAIWGEHGETRVSFPKDVFRFSWLCCRTTPKRPSSPKRLRSFWSLSGPGRRDKRTKPPKWASPPRKSEENQEHRIDGCSRIDRTHQQTSHDRRDSESGTTTRRDRHGRGGPLLEKTTMEGHGLGDSKLKRSDQVIRSSEHLHLLGWCQKSSSVLVSVLQTAGRVDEKGRFPEEEDVVHRWGGRERRARGIPRDEETARSPWSGSRGGHGNQKCSELGDRELWQVTWLPKRWKELAQSLELEVAGARWESDDWLRRTKAARPNDDRRVTPRTSCQLSVVPPFRNVASQSSGRTGMTWRNGVTSVTSLESLSDLIQSQVRSL